MVLVMKKPSFPNSPEKKKPLDPREDPLARDSRGKASREDVRKVTNVPAPRASQRSQAQGDT